MASRANRLCTVKCLHQHNFQCTCSEGRCSTFVHLSSTRPRTAVRNKERLSSFFRSLNVLLCSKKCPNSTTRALQWMSRHFNTPLTGTQLVKLRKLFDSIDKHKLNYISVKALADKLTSDSRTYALFELPANFVDCARQSTPHVEHNNDINRLLTFERFCAAWRRALAEETTDSDTSIMVTNRQRNPHVPQQQTRFRSQSRQPMQRYAERQQMNGDFCALHMPSSNSCLGLQRHASDTSIPMNGHLSDPVKTIATVAPQHHYSNSGRISMPG